MNPNPPRLRNAMEQHESDIQPIIEVSQEPKRPFSIRLTQIWLAVVGVLPMLAVVFGFLHSTYIAITQEVTTPKSTAEAASALLQMSFLVSFGVYALITIWGLQKRARVSRWLAMIVIAFVTAKSAYYTLWSKEFWIENWPAELLLIDATFVLAIALLQLTMLYRFAFGKAEKAFLSK